MADALRQIIVTQGRLAVAPETIGEDDDLFAAGLDSLAIVNVMLAIEETFSVEFPDHLLTRRSFSTLATLRGIIASLQGALV